ncbi:hypothetical protein HZY91_07730 [Facklamia sp. DSM 111018]|uniref:Uncharacterized protein n=1 Tax=Facklamia lactis TaxID=2749967 RepID=A0ABS0LRK1_9LACT|nr:hypothetical protein [Facklamia lactis]MBG9980851.1 hypothetical protein [Facklamia lactis]MBG9986786.1 hypothetical protein [Facklamia lactis]
MSLVTIVSEFWRFFKDYFWRIMMGAVIVSVLTVGGRYFINRFLYRDNQEAYQQLSEIYSQEPASFQIVVTMEDGSIFTTAELFDAYFSAPEIVSEIEQKTGIQFGQWLEYEKQLEMYKTNEFRGGLAGIRDASSNVITMRFLVGKKTEDNLKIAKAYADMMRKEELPFLGPNKISFVQEPVKGEVIPIELTEEVPSQETLTPFRTAEAKSHFIYGILGLMIGTALTSLLCFLSHLGKKKIIYAFDYAWDYHDHHFMSQHGKEDKSLEQLIQTPTNIERVVLRQQSKGDPDHSFNNQLCSLSDYKNEKRLDEIVILIQSHLTDKAWYHRERQLANLYPAQVKIIHII